MEIATIERLKYPNSFPKIGISRRKVQDRRWLVNEMMIRSTIKRAQCPGVLGFTFIAKTLIHTLFLEQAQSKQNEGFHAFHRKYRCCCSICRQRKIFTNININ
jgi:hypothetical protein